MTTHCTAHFKKQRTATGAGPHVYHTHVDQARTWYRYANCLQDCPFDARRKRNDALAHSLHLRSRTFVLPTRMELPPEAAQGLYLLRRCADEHRFRFVELAARAIVVDEENPAADEVHLFLEAPDRTSSRNRRHFVGLLPREDASWVVPLLRLESDAYGTGPILRFFAKHCAVRSKTHGGVSMDDVRVVIAHAHEAARHWLDWKEERIASYNASYRLRYYDEQAWSDKV